MVPTTPSLGGCAPPRLRRLWNRLYPNMGRPCVGDSAATMADGRWPQPSPSEQSILYGNPYYSVVRPGRRTLLFNEWGITGFNRGFVSYPSFVDAKSGYIIVSERDNHRLQIFDNVGAPSRFDR